MFLKNGLVFFLIASQLSCLTIYGQWQNRDTRIDPILFPLQYWSIHHKVKRQMRSAGEQNIADHLCKCPIPNTPHNEEVCLHNRFLLLDFILYYDLINRYRTDAISREDFAINVARARDDLYGQWMVSLASYVPDGYFEWENRRLDTVSLEAYLKLGSKRFRHLQRASSLFNRKPPLRKPAKRLAYEKLRAHTPFSSIQPEAGFEISSDSQLLGQLTEVLETLRQNQFEYENTIEMLSEITGSQEEALFILGTLAAQRMYMVRDYRSWLIQQPDSSLSSARLQAFKLASELYFTLESAGREFGTQKLLPVNVVAHPDSYKAYHFWTTALLSYQLAQAGFPEQTCVREAVRPARKYKRFIQIPGVMHNALLLRPLRSGTTADVQRVLREQQLGAHWGYDFYRKHHDEAQPN